jgi:CHAD domain-containing protein
MTQIKANTGNGQTEAAEIDPDEFSRLGPLVESLGDTCGAIAAEMAQLRKALEATRLKSMRNATTSDYAYAMLRQIFSDFLAHEPGTRRGEDPEELHQMRVASRRLRATIDLFQPALSTEWGEFNEELRWVGQVLGNVRDLQVQRESLDSLIDESETRHLGPLIEKLEERTQQAQVEAVQALESPRYQSLVQRMTNALLAGGEATEAGGSQVRPYAALAIRDRYSAVRKKASRLRADSPDTELHKARIRTKRLRYAVETFQPLFGRRFKPLRLETKALQDLLGEHQDHVAARAWMREIAVQEATELPPETLVQIGELIERRRQEMIRIRLLWPAAYARLRERWRRARRDLAS